MPHSRHQVHFRPKNQPQYKLQYKLQNKLIDARCPLKDADRFNFGQRLGWSRLEPQKSALGKSSLDH